MHFDFIAIIEADLRFSSVENFNHTLKYKHRYIFYAMKTLLFSLFVPVVFLFSGSTKPIDKEHCSCENIPLYGDVKVVESFGDFKVKVVERWEDLDVESVKYSPSHCGEWRFVESFPDFTIEYVESFPDFTIKFVEHFPGMQ